MATCGAASVNLNYFLSSCAEYSVLVLLILWFDAFIAL